MKTFEAGKNAEELGIDLSRKLVVVTGNESFIEGEIISLAENDNSNCPFFYKNNGDGDHCIHWDKLAYAENTWDNLAVGDVLIDSAGRERTILGICGSVVFYSSTRYKDMFNTNSYENDYSSLAHLKNNSGWTIKGGGEESDDVTVECEGEKRVISRKSAKSLGLIK